MSDRDIAVGEVSCLGQCDSAPAMSLNGHSHWRSDRSLKGPRLLIFAALGGSEMSPPHPGPRLTGLPADPYKNSEPYSVLRQLAETKDWAGVITQLKASGLPGMGGAGFPAGIKWEAVRNAPGTEKYVVCNADESEPGTIKDRFILEHLPHLVAEGMIIAGLVTGARRGILYIRHEYEAQEHIFLEEIERLKEQGIVGANVCGFLV